MTSQNLSRASTANLTLFSSNNSPSSIESPFDRNPGIVACKQRKKRMSDSTKHSKAIEFIHEKNGSELIRIFLCLTKNTNMGYHFLLKTEQKNFIVGMIEGFNSMLLFLLPFLLNFISFIVQLLFIC